MRIAVCIGLLGLLSSACSEGKKRIDDAGTRTPDSALPVVDSGVSADAANTGDAGGDGQCPPQRSATMRVGEAGGTILLCGASVAVAADVLREPVGLTLRVVELPEPLPYSLEQAGLAFALEIEGTVPSLPEPPFSVLVPHGPTTRHLYFYRVAGEYQQIEACTAEEKVIGQTVGVAGTYVALVDVEDFPESRTDLGSGSLETSFDGQMDSFDFDSKEFDTYAIYDEAGDGSRTYTLSATKPLPADNLTVARLTFVQAPDGSAEMIEVTYGDLNGLWSYLPFNSGTSEIAVKSTPGVGLEGTFSVELMLGEQKKTLSGSFAAQADKYRYPPSLSCGTIDG